MTNLKQNSQLVNTEVYENQQTEIVGTISSFFDSHQEDEAKALLTDLHHAWKSELRLFKSHQDIANMVYFVNNLNALIRKTSGFDCVESPIDVNNSEDVINEALHLWIVADAKIKRNDFQLIEGQAVFNTMASFLDVCIEIQKGGVLCA